MIKIFILVISIFFLKYEKLKYFYKQIFTQ